MYGCEQELDVSTGRVLHHSARPSPSTASTSSAGLEEGNLSARVGEEEYGYVEANDVAEEGAGGEVAEITESSLLLDGRLRKGWEGGNKERIVVDIDTDGHESEEVSTYQIPTCHNHGTDHKDTCCGREQHKH